LQGPSQRQREDENDDIADNTNHRVGNQSGSLVETGTFHLLSEPVSRNWTAHADLDDQSDGVVCAKTGEETIDEPHLATVGLEDAREDRQESDFDEKGHWAIKDSGDVAELFELNLVGR
jgi:hypothetical protein